MHPDKHIRDAIEFAVSEGCRFGGLAFRKIRATGSRVRSAALPWCSSRLLPVFCSVNSAKPTESRKKNPFDSECLSARLKGPVNDL
jgi:hypothetical protein